MLSTPTCVSISYISGSLLVMSGLPTHHNHKATQLAVQSI